MSNEQAHPAGTNSTEPSSKGRNKHSVLQKNFRRLSNAMQYKVIKCKFDQYKGKHNNKEKNYQIMSVI